MHTAIAALRMAYEAQKLQAIVHMVKFGRGSGRSDGRGWKASAMPRWVHRAFVARPTRWALAIGGMACPGWGGSDGGVYRSAVGGLLLRLRGKRAERLRRAAEFLLEQLIEVRNIGVANRP